MKNNIGEECDSGIPEEIVKKVRRIVLSYCEENGLKDNQIEARTEHMLKAVQDGIEEILSEEEKRQDRRTAEIANEKKTHE